MTIRTNGQIIAGPININETLSTASVSLVVANWSNNTQTVTVNGITSNSLVWVSPANSSLAEYGDCKVYCSQQGTNSLTFTCSTTPSNALTVEVIYG